jgi:hypothetical protein
MGRPATDGADTDRLDSDHLAPDRLDRSRGRFIEQDTRLLRAHGGTDSRFF